MELRSTIERPSYTLTIVDPISDPENCNVDAYVKLRDSRRFGVTFFTIENIRALFEKNRQTGECANGAYFRAIDMVILERIDAETMIRTIDEMIENDELEQALSLYPDDDDS